MGGTHTHPQNLSPTGLTKSNPCGPGTIGGCLLPAWRPIATSSTGRAASHKQMAHRPPLACLLACLLTSTACWAAQPAEEQQPWYRASQSRGAGGGQAQVEAIRAHTLAHVAPAHPLHADRPTVRSGESGTAGPFVVGSETNQPFSHFFETSVGSGHMSLTLREDWRQHIRMAARDLGVKHIRGHGLLDDDMSVSYAYGKHAFYNIDSLVDVLASVGMRPIFELSFMPDWLTSGNHTVCHYKGNSDPPKNYTEWGELIGALGEHMVTKYGEQMASEFYFEVWKYVHTPRRCLLHCEAVPLMRRGGMKPGLSSGPLCIHHASRRFWAG
jgi:hypothetical protein